MCDCHPAGEALYWLDLVRDPTREPFAQYLIPPGPGPLPPRFGAARDSERVRCDEEYTARQMSFYAAHGARGVFREGDDVAGLGLRSGRASLLLWSWCRGVVAAVWQARSRLVAEASEVPRGAGPRMLVAVLSMLALCP